MDPVDSDVLFGEGPSAAVTMSALLELMPQTHPFLYVDRICEVDAHHIVTEYTFRKTEWLYQGHFSDGAMTPGVIHLEAMAQAGLVLQGIYLLALELPLNEVKQYRGLFTDSSVEWFAPIRPEETVRVTSNVLAWRRQRIRAKAEMWTIDGVLVASATMAGKGILWTGE